MSSWYCWPTGALTPDDLSPRWMSLVTEDTKDVKGKTISDIFLWPRKRWMWNEKKKSPYSILRDPFLIIYVCMSSCWGNVGYRKRKIKTKNSPWHFWTFLIICVFNYLRSNQKSKKIVETLDFLNNPISICLSNDANWVKRWKSLRLGRWLRDAVMMWRGVGEVYGSRVKSNSC